ncbi:MAG: Gfo/Idh/MocA family oxidoreductase [Solobacterium sp.]|nr:Gfo/Idh/MocA family oxidoreductase [Solobacterium sp.]
MSVTPIGIGVIGCGMISKTYLPNMAERFSILKIVGVADLIEERAKEAAEKYNTVVMTNDEIYNCPDIQIVVNLTNVWSHYEVTKAALEHGKHVYCEKMMAENFERAKELFDLANSKGLRIAMAPDTCLGGGYQTVRKLVDDGFIGKPFAVNATIVRSYLQSRPAVGKNNVVMPGGTIPFDMGGYYIHAMQTVFGSINRVSGFGTYLHKTYSHPANPKYGEDFVVEGAPNFIQAALEFNCGVFGTLTAGDYGVMEREPAGLYIYGTEGTLICPDPNMFGGPIKLLTNTTDGYVEMPLTHGYHGHERTFGPPKVDPDWRTEMWKTSRRGVGVAELAWSIYNDRPCRLSNEMGLHTIELIHGVMEGTETGKYYTMTTHPKRMAALRSGFTGADAEAVFDDHFGYDFDAEPKWKW